MAENATGNQQGKQRYSRLAIASSIISILCVLVLPLSIFNDRRPDYIILGIEIAGPIAVLGLILAICALRAIKRVPTLAGRRAAIISAVFTALLVLLLLLLLLAQMTSRKRSVAVRFVCGSHLSQLGKAMLIYANDHGGQFPDPNSWCDLLMKNSGVTTEQFFCPSTSIRVYYCSWQIYPGKHKKQKSYFAMNPNCTSLNCDPNMVLLFDSVEGWNLSGGPELVCIKRHGGDGCNVMFVDGPAFFIRANGLQKLNWGGNQP